MKNREPEFMKELHRIRAKLSKEWRKMSDKEFLNHMHKVGIKFKQSLPANRAISTSRT